MGSLHSSGEEGNKQHMKDKAGSHNENFVRVRILNANGVISSILNGGMKDKKEPAKQKMRW